MNSKINYLNIDSVIWVLGIRIRIKLSRSFHEIRLTRRTCILAPKSLKIYSTYIASTPISSKYSIDLSIGVDLRCIIIQVTTSKFSVIFDTLSQILNKMRLIIYFLRPTILMNFIHTSTYENRYKELED
jgi:hypothetical protein